MFATKM